MSAESDIAQQWLGKAENDLLNADNNLVAQQIPFDTVCFHCQQAAEKMLKAFLLTHGKAYPITHDLLLILEPILPLDSEAERLRSILAILNPYAVAIRYPDVSDMPTAADADEAWRAAETVRSWLKTRCQKLFHP